MTAFFLAPPACARRRKQGRTDRSGVRDLSGKEYGYSVSHAKGRVESVFVYVTAKDDFAAFGGELLHRLTPGDTQDETRRKIGTPTRSGFGDEEKRWPWDRFDTAGKCLPVAYGEGGVGGRMMTLIVPDVAP